MIVPIEPKMTGIASSLETSFVLISFGWFIIGGAMFFARYKFVLNPFKGFLLTKMTGTKTYDFR
jgi:hypothetical protein